MSAKKSSIPTGNAGLVYDLPMLPNFIQTGTADGKHRVSMRIADIPDKDLRRIGRAWTEKLVETAQARRKAAKK